MIKQVLRSSVGRGGPGERTTREHPVFARVYGAVSALVERGEVGRRREELLAQAYGRLLVVGLGPGHDLAHVPPAVSEVVAVEPSGAMTRQAGPRAESLRRRGTPVGVAAAVAEALPLPDASIDSVLFAFVLCSVESPPQALAEVRRVLRPGGMVLLLEHVRAPEGSPLERVQRRVDRVWQQLAGGCSCHRDTGSAVREAGFDDGQLRELWLANFPLCVRHLYGVAPR